jgi:hypothetical protein
MVSKKYIIGCTMLATALFACSKKEAFDVKGDPGIKIFLNNPVLGNFIPNSVNYTVVNYPLAGGGLNNLSSTVPATVKIPVFATRELGQNITVNTEIDNSLVAAYNTANGTSYKAFPEGFLTAENLNVLIEKGKDVSSDSIVLKTDNSKLTGLTAGRYIAPVKLKSVSSQQTGTITSNTALQVVYITADVEVRQIKFLATAAEAQGSLLTGRNAWGITFTPQPTTVGSVVDGSTTTFSRWTASPVVVDVNLQSSRNITGIRLHTATSTTYSPSQVNVQVSDDGINYTNLGTPLRANLTYASAYTYILFYVPVPAKYIRLNMGYVTNTNTQNYRLTELDVYAAN